MSDPSKLSQQELVDYLVQAVEEEDVLFCVLWLQEMARRGLVCSREGELKADGINLEHSWKKRSALVTAVNGPASRFRHFILILLLVHVRDVMSCAAMTAAIALRATWATSVLNSWQSPAVQGTSIVRTPRELLAMPATEAANWIDANLPPHPSPDSLTGCGPLPERPQQAATATLPSSLLHDASTAGKALPTLPPPSFVAPTTNLATRQVRLCDIQKKFNVNRLGNLLPPMEGLQSSMPVEKDAAILTFDSAGTARKALLLLQGSDYFRTAVLESVFQTAALAGHSPSRPSAPCQHAVSAPSPASMSSPHVPRDGPASQTTASSADQARATRLPPIGWSPAASNQVQGVLVHIGDLPLDVTTEEVEALLAFVGVAHWSLGLKRRNNRSSAYFRVSSREEYSRIASVLHNSHFRGRRIRAEREPPRPSANHPIVVVHNMPFTWGYHAVDNLMRSTRLAVYGAAMQPLEDGRGIGRFRCSSPASAQEAVDRLNGTTHNGVKLDVEWTNGDGTAPSLAPQATGEAVDALTSSAPVTAAPVANELPTASSAPVPVVSEVGQHKASSETSATTTTTSALASGAVASPTVPPSFSQPFHMPPSPLSTPAPETPSLPEPFAFPPSSYPHPATFVTNVTPPVSPATVTKGLPSTMGDLWGQELQGRRKASSDGGGEKERAAKRRK